MLTVRAWGRRNEGQKRRAVDGEEAAFSGGLAEKDELTVTGELLEIRHGLDDYCAAGAETLSLVCHFVGSHERGRRVWYVV